MATITPIRGKGGTSYRAQIRKFEGGKVVYSEAKTFSSKAIATKWAALREAQLTPAEIAKARANVLTVGDLIARYETEFAGTGGRTKQADIKRLKSYDFCTLPVDALTSEVLIAHVRERLHSVLPQTVNNDLVWLRNVFRAAYPAWGIKLDAAEIDAARRFCVSKGMVAKSAERDRRPTQDELQRLDAHFASRDGRADIPMRDVMWFAIHSARRQAEITRLRWPDNNEAHRTGLVREIKHPRKKGLNKEFKYTPEAWAIVERQPRTGEFIFPYNPKSIGAAFARACKLLEIDDLTFHDLRHDATSRLFEAGYSIPQVQLFTLHEDWKTLQRYVNLRPSDLA